MARKTFFSFHYERDIWRASRVRNSWVTKPDRESAGFWDAASWESVQRQGEEAVKRWIDRQINGTSITVVLIGYETSGRKYVRYEIEKSYMDGNGLLGIYISKIFLETKNRPNYIVREKSGLTLGGNKHS